MPDQKIISPKNEHNLFEAYNRTVKVLKAKLKTSQRTFKLANNLSSAQNRETNFLV